MRSLIASRTGVSPRRELLLERTGEKAERAPTRHVRTGQDDLADAARAIEIRRVGRRDPGLAGPRGTEHDDLRTRVQRVEIIGLVGVERPDRRRRSFGSEFVLVQGNDLGGVGGPAVATLRLLDALGQWQNPFVELADAKRLRARPPRARNASKWEKIGCSDRNGARGGGSVPQGSAPTQSPIEAWSPACRMRPESLIRATVSLLATSKRRSRRGDEAIPGW